MIKQLARYLVYSLGFVGLYSCGRSFELASLSPNLLIPIAHGSLNISDYDFGDQIQFTGSDTLVVNYYDTLYSLGLDDIIGLPDTTVSSEFIVPFSGITFPPGVPFYSEVKNMTYKIGGVQLKKASLKEGVLKLKLQNTLDKPVLFTYTISSATKDGDTLQIDEIVPANSSFTKSYSIGGYDLNLRGAAGNQFNTISGQFAVMIDPNETQGHQLQLGDKFTAQITFSGIVPESLFGYFGSRNSSLSDTVETNIFADFPFDSLAIEKFNVKLLVDNGLGADLKMNIHSMKSVNSINGKSANFQAALIGADLKLNRAVDLNSNNVKHQQLSFELNEANSNLDRMIEVAPNRIELDLDVYTNPYGNISLGNDFAYYDHPLSLILNAELPLAIGLDRLHLADTTDFQFTLTEEQHSALDHFKSGYFKVELNNGFELGADLQVYMLDTLSGNVIDSLFEHRINVEAGYQENGQSRLMPNYIEVSVTKSKIEHLTQSNALKVDSYLGTKNAAVSNLKGSGSINFRIAAQINAGLP